MIAREIEKKVINEETYWFVPSSSRPRRGPASAYLLPNYDEYLVAYKGRGLVIDRGRNPFAHHLVIDGRVSGTWRRTVKGDSILVEMAPYKRLLPGNTRALAAAVKRYSQFMHLPVTLSSKLSSV